MKAIVWTDYGTTDVLQYKEIDKPAPKDNEVLIKIHAATVTAGDCELRSFDIPNYIWLPARIAMGIFKPRIPVLGQELAGGIEAVGKEVKTWKPGDRVFAAAGMGLGAYAQYVCKSKDTAMAKIPEGISYEEAAAIPTGGLNALHFLRKAKLQKGETLLINGAGGSIGTCGIQLAKHYGAEVTAVDSGEKLDMLRDIGADHVIDYTKQDFTRNGKTYDVIIDVVGKSSYARSVKSLNPHGRYVLGNPRLWMMLRGLWTSMTGNKKVFFQLARESKEDLDTLAELVESGKIKILIDKRYPLEQTAEAHKYVETGAKKGNVIITIEQG